MSPSTLHTPHGSSTAAAWLAHRPLSPSRRMEAMAGSSGVGSLLVELRKLLSAIRNGLFLPLYAESSPIAILTPLTRSIGTLRSRSSLRKIAWAVSTASSRTSIAFSTPVTGR